MSEHDGRGELSSAGHDPRFDQPEWWIYHGTGRPVSETDLTDLLPEPPPWRSFDGGPLPAHEVIPPDDGDARRRLGADVHTAEFAVDPREIDLVNAALCLRRPLLVTGKPGIGKSALAYRIARELRLGRVLNWPITSRTTLKVGQYGYDAIGRAQAATARRTVAADAVDEIAEPPIGEFIRLGPLGTAFLPRRLPRVLLIDELDKSEADLPNDLLSIFEDGQYTIPELARVRNRQPEVTVFTDDPDETAVVVGGRVRCRAFPVIVVTSNGEREFPPAFLRRCIRLEMRDPDANQLAAMVAAHLLEVDGAQQSPLVREFLARSAAVGGLPADKLMDAVFLATSGAYRTDPDSWQRLVDALWRQLLPNGS